MDKSHEPAFVRAFIEPSKQDRWLELLANPKRRTKITATLAHSAPLSTRHIQKIPPDRQRASDIAALLRSKGAPGMCHVVSEDATLDGKELNLDEALDQIVGYGMGSLVSCIPGKLAYYEAEDPGERCLLEPAAI